MVETEIAIIGGGPGGCSAALALAKRGIKSTLIEKSIFPRDKVCGDALSGKVMLSLQRLDQKLPIELIEESFTLPSHGVSFYSPNGKCLDVPFKRIMDKSNPPGLIAKRIDFDNWLFNQTCKHPLINVMQGVAVHKYERSTNGWKLICGDSIGISAKLIISAEGAQGKFAKEFGNIKVENDHYCAGIRSYYENVEGLNQDGFIELHFVKEFLPGYFWIFPLKNGCANVGVGIRSDVVSKRKMNLKHAMSELIQNHPTISKRFKNAKVIDGMKGYGLPLGSKKRRISGDRFMLLGDTAALIDPFTGEGIGNAMISGIKAAETIASLQNSSYSEKELLAYDQSVYQRLWPELSLSKKMQELVKYPWLFNLVVNKANHSPTLKNTISCMFEDMDIRNQLSSPKFYMNILLGR